jgi:hypothetical protein
MKGGDQMDNNFENRRSRINDSEDNDMIIYAKPNRNNEVAKNKENSLQNTTRDAENIVVRAKGNKQKIITKV